MSNKEKFTQALAAEYAILFKTQEYAIAASRYTPEALAEKFTEGLLNGSAANDGDGVKRACKALGIKSTYKAIREFCGA